MRSSWLAIVLVACGEHAHLDRVDPFIGTGGGSDATPISAGPGNTFPGAVVPWGMVSVSPHTDVSAPAGYRAGAPLFHGFGHVHLSGVGCPELGHVVVMPTLALADRTSRYTGEVAHPGYYRVQLRTGIVAEATALRRAGLSRFTFPAGSASILVDASAGSVPSRGGSVRVVSPTEIEGEVTAGGFCEQDNEHTLHFVVRTSRPAIASGTWTGATRSATARATGTQIGAFLTFATRASDAIEVAVGVSYVDLAGARANLAGTTTWDFDLVRRRAEDAWDQVLGRIEVEGGSAEQQRVFATALYHALLHPSVFSDATSDRDRYTVFSLWDTYRTLHPLLSLVYPDVQRDMARTLVDLARTTGALPRWELAGDDTGVMVGDPAMIVLADTYARGITGFGLEDTYPILLQEAMAGHLPGHAAYAQHGFIPYDDTGGDWVFGTVATTLEYGLADAALATLASALGHGADAAGLRERSLGYRALFDPSLRHLRPRNTDGSWLAPFDPSATCCDKPWPESGGPGFVEGSAWTYDFAALHDLEHLIEMFGGPGAFVTRLDEHLARHFALGNEPDFATPYLYAIAGRPDRTAEVVRQLAARFRDAPDGLPGNDDAGALSAWYVWTALGLYPVRPADPRLWIGSPLFDRTTLHLPGGTFTIVAEDNAPDHVYVQAAELDGRRLDRTYLRHDELAHGGTLRLHMGNHPGPPPWGPAR